MLASRPLVSSAFAQSLLDVSEDAIVELAEEGLLYPCFHIESPSAKAREFRIPFASLAWYASTHRPLPVDPDQVVSDLLPPDLLVTTVSLRRTLDCRQTHIADLLAAKAFALVSGSKIRRGPGGAGRVDRKSAMQFLLSRIL